ncbi:hypothetical protein [Solicola gregarius]|uniref:Uncharacterized protein n=1 Tax=Solicola gregarius TaxID=2908642 RepID=A0AA46THF0_9ACTN|nr:hypothetical protein [Solicola gregarius]UYM05371.1 hypothetical protein L0C25_23155 [Solicola gregarius]
MSGRQKRLKAELALGSASCLAFVIGVAAWIATADVALESKGGLVALWWGCLIAGAALGVGAFRIEDDSEDAHYLSSIVAGIRREWRHTSVRH